MSALWWACGEDIEFPTRHTYMKSDTAATKRRTAYVRAALGNTASGATTHTTIGAVMADGVPLAAPLNDGWFSCQYFHFLTAGESGSAARPSVGLGGSAVVGGLFIGRLQTNYDKLALFKITSAGVATTLAVEVASTYTSAALARFDIHFTGWDSVSGTVDVYLNGASTPQLSFSGDLTCSGVPDLDRFRLMGDSKPGEVADYQHVSEVIIADEDTRSFAGVASLAPTAAGTTNTFDTGAYTDVDEVVVDDADLIASATVAQEFDCNINDLPAGDFVVRGIKVSARAVRGATGPATLKVGVNSGGTRDTADRSLTTALETHERMMELNPITGLRFTTAETNALQICLKSAT